LPAPGGPSRTKRYSIIYIIHIYNVLYITYIKRIDMLTYIYSHIASVSYMWLYITMMI